jgi:hypothetical protein
MRSLLAACGTAVCSCACCLLLLCWCLLVAMRCAAKQLAARGFLAARHCSRELAPDSHRRGGQGGVAPGPETRSDSPNRLVTNKPKAQLPAEIFSSHFSGPEATADLGGHPPAMCDDMGRCSLRVEPPHSVLARAPNQRSGTWPYAPPATSLWVKQVTAIQPEPIPPKDDQQGLRPSSQDHISCCAYDLRTTHKAI